MQELAGYHRKFGEAAQELRDARIEDDTKYQNGRKIEAIKRWFHEQEEYQNVIFLQKKVNSYTKDFEFLWLPYDKI